MESPWSPPQRSTADRPRGGMIVLLGVPFVALILIRLFWSGSSLWFLGLGIILLAGAAVTFLVQRPREDQYGRAVSEEPSRMPLILTGLGVVLLAMLLLPNYSGGGSGRSPSAQQLPPASDTAGQDTATSDTAPPEGFASDVLSDSELPASVQDSAPPEEQAAGEQPASDRTYVVQSGDNLWDIAARFATSVDAVVEANALANPTELQVGQELLIPPPEAEDEQAGALP